jgi:hypothetical protein
LPFTLTATGMSGGELAGLDTVAAAPDLIVLSTTTVMIFFL